MEEKRLVEKFNDVFVKTIPILDNVKKGFLTQNLDIVKENKAQFRAIAEITGRFYPENHRRKG